MNSLVITACGRDLSETLDSIKWNTDVPFEFVLIDNTPACFGPGYDLDGVVKGLRRADRPVPPIRIVKLANDVDGGEPRVKIAELWNAGMNAAAGDKIAMCGDDNYFGWHSLDHLFLALEKFGVLCVYPLHTDVRMPPWFKERARAIGAGEPMLSVGRQSGFCGNAFAATKACWDKFGPFDTRFQWACADDDWEMWLKWNGCEPREVCTSLIHHYVGGSSTGHMSSVTGLKGWLQRRDQEDRREFMKKWHMGQRPAKVV